MTKRCGKLQIVKRVRKSYIKCRCDCGNEIEVLQKDFVAKKYASCGCVSNTALEDKIIKWLEEHKIPYVFDFSVTLFNGATFKFDMLIPKDEGYIIQYDQYLALENLKYNSSMEIKNKEASVMAHIELISKNFGIPLLKIEYGDLDKVDEILSEFFGIGGESNG